MEPIIKRYIQSFTKDCDDILFGSKDHDYNDDKTFGVNTMFPYGYQSAFTFINKHFNRLQVLYTKGVTPKNESIEDNWKDLCNYVRMSYAALKFQKALRGELAV